MESRWRISLTAPGMSRLIVLQWLLAAVLVGALSVTGSMWWHSRTLAMQIHDMEQAIADLQAHNRRARMQAQADGLDLSEARMRRLPQEIDFAQRLQRLEGFSWTQFLNDLESAVPANVSLESVVLNFKDSSIALRGTAKTLDDLNGFVGSLERHPAFRDVVLSRHAAKSAAANAKGKRVIAFSLTVLYKRVDRV